jgi:hypothetical protein
MSFLVDHGVEIEMGPGRHPESTAIFSYFLGPEGFTWRARSRRDPFVRAGLRTFEVDLWRVNEAPSACDSRSAPGTYQWH